MNMKTLVTLGRLACGTAIFITSMVTGQNGVFQMVSLVLMGVPFEALQKSDD